MVAFARACTLIDLLITWPMRWLAGKATQLDNWLPIRMGIVYDLLDSAMVETAQNGAYLFDTSLHIFESVADEQPLFQAYIEKDLREEMVHSPNGLNRFSKHEPVLVEAQTPSDPSNVAATTATIELLEVMAATAIVKMYDPKISVDDKLTSQEGANAYYSN
eukprot:6211072-Pleurochrysis_carterae.AAC.1